MVKGILKSIGGVVGVGIAVFAAIAAAGLAGDGLEEAFGTPEKSSDGDPQGELTKREPPRQRRAGCPSTDGRPFESPGKVDE